MVKQWLCTHKWGKVQEFYTESSMEQVLATTGQHLSPKNIYSLEAMTQRKHISTFTCDKCGKIKRFVEEV